MKRRGPFRFFWEDGNWNPWEELDNISGGNLSGIPIDLSENDESIVVKANMPGIDKKDVSLRVLNNRLVIDTKHSQEEREEKDNYFRQEIRSGKFHREIFLPVEVDEEFAEAEMINRVLEIRLPKKDKGKKKGKEVRIN